MGPSAASASRWTSFVHRCLLRRLPGHEFRQLASKFNQSCQISGDQVAGIILECRQSFSSFSDPLIPQYCRAIILSGLCEVSALLRMLIENWNSRKLDRGLALEIQKPGCLSSPDALIINDLALIVASKKPGPILDDIRESLLMTSTWLVALIGWISEDAQNRSYLALLSLLEALGILLASLASTDHGLTILSDEENVDTRLQCTDALEAILPSLNSTSTQLFTRLDMIQKHFGLFRSSLSKQREPLKHSSETMPDPLEFEAGLAERPTLHARANLFVYLNAMLTARSVVSDTVLMAYLRACYMGDHVSMFIDVIVAAFDVLSNGHARSEGKQAIKVYHSFLMNRLPNLLVQISASSLTAVPATLCIQQALDRIDLSTFPISAYDLERRSPLAGIRQEFLFACALHRLITEQSVEGLLGENPMQTLPFHGLYDRDQLVQQITANPVRGEHLINEIELMEGNAGVVANALVDVMHSHCNNKDTVQLKDICNLLIRKAPVLDIVTIFRPPVDIIDPLCALLNEWNWQELQGETQPVYEEFGAVLLLILCIAERFDLGPYEIETASPTSFVRQLFEIDNGGEVADGTDPQSEKRLDEWINALFVADSLSDELTSSCSPHEFFMLVPTILDQSMEACARGRLSVETLKSGLDYLREPFLLPAVLLGLQWVAKELWRATGTITVKLSVLQTLIKPPTSTESNELHQTILSLVAERLCVLLQPIANVESHQQTAAAIMKSLSSQITPRRTANWVPEVFLPTPTHSAGLAASLIESIHQLVNWSMLLDVNTPPPRFTFKVILGGVQLYGAARMIEVLLRELKLLLATAKFDAALDVIAAVVCAPSSTSHDYARHLSLQGALTMAHADTAKTLKKGDIDTAEALIRLYRRVATLSMGVSQAEVVMDPTTAIDHEISNIALDGIDMDSAADTAQLNVPALEAPSNDLSQILDRTNAVGNNGTTGLSTVMEDPFGLNSGDMQMMNFDDMDLEGMFP